MGGGAKFKIGGKAKGGAKFKIGGKHKIGGKLHIKIGGKAKVKVTYKAKAGFDNKVAPKDFLKGTSCRTSFDAAYNMLYAVNHARKAVGKTAFGCFKAIAQLRGELSCAVCDNSKSKFLNDPSKSPVQPANLTNLGQCIMMIRYFHTYQEFLTKMLDLAGVLGKDVTAAKKALGDLKIDDTKDCENKA